MFYRPITAIFVGKYMDYKNKYCFFYEEQIR
jgi:hypothetical protein